MLFEKKPTKTCNLHIRLFEDEKDELKKIAKEYNMTVSEFIRNATNEYIKKLESKEQQLNDNL